ncbi:Developmental pluripotency-associated protein 4 [Microtus ochrogaster]|uniref:Developmental pluripotency-associated protein 4 n=1 Tax=Microtus ochrogaster TaxID=79684 RepID=A0A8J6FW98_MICOH|nr:Developmental pluripotency-associated protein 4 [Microtus ochrogaster]
MPELENIPDTPKEARVKICWKKMKTKTEEGQESCPQVIVPLEMVPVPEEQLPTLTEPPVLYEEVSTTTVTTTASEAVLVSWSRIVDNANKNEALQSITTPETYGDL